MVIGDVSDNIKGLKGKGEAWCKKNFKDLTVEKIRSLVLYEYIKAYGESQGIYNFQQNYRLLHMLESDEDCMREVGYLLEIRK